MNNSGLVAGNHDSLMNLVDVHEMTIESAFDQANERGNEVDWEARIKRASAIIAEIGKVLTDTSPADVIGGLDSHKEVVEKVRKMAAALLD